MKTIFRKNIHSKQEKKELGAFFTPSYLANTITESAINHFVIKKVNLIFSSPYKSIDEVLNTNDPLTINKLSEIISNIKILDCAAGEGEFLIAALNYVTKIKQKTLNRLDKNLSYLNSEKSSYLRSNLFGMEIDMQTINKCHNNLLDLFPTEERPLLKKELQKNIIHGNFLDSHISDWRNLKDCFEVILGNPPWGVKLRREDKTKYHTKLKLNSSKRNLNIFELFIYQSSKLLLPSDGILAFLLPKNFVRSNHYTLLREFIVKNFQIIELNFHGLFKDVTQEFISLFVRYTTLIPSTHNILIDKTIKIPQSFYLTNTDFIFSKEYNSDSISLIQLIQKNSVPLTEFVTIRRGEELSQKGGVMFCSSCLEWVPLSSRKKVVECSICQKILQGNNLKTKFLIQKSQDLRFSQPILTGDDFDTFIIKSSHFIDPTINYKSKKNIGIYKSPKLVVQKIKRFPCSAFDSDNHWTTQNVYNLTLVTKYSNNIDLLYYLLAILNSKIMRRYYEIQFNLGSQYTNAISIRNLKRLPIKKPIFEDPLFKQIIDLSKKIVSGKEKNKINSRIHYLNQLINHYYNFIDN